MKSRMYFYTGYPWGNWLDALFIGSVCLIIFKLIYRIIFLKNPFWSLNILIFLFGIALELKTKYINDTLRKIIVLFWKSLLGQTYCVKTLLKKEKIEKIYNKIGQYIFIKISTITFMDNKISIYIYND